jgi:cyanobactin maturation PatA/PatG family protease
MSIQSASNTLAGIRSALSSAGTGSSSITIGVVDGLPDLSHPALRNASVEILKAMVPPDSSEPDAHGTSVCSLIFGRGESIRGLAPGCSGLILPLFFRKRTEGQLQPVSQLDLARAISFGLEHDVSIIDISAGQKSATAETESHLDQVLQQAKDRRVLLVAAAGNYGCPYIHLPAAVEFVLSVGALDAAGRPLETSNWAESYRRNGLLAPGDNLPVAILGGGVSTGSGTSFATAIVSGVAALLLSVARQEGYQIDPLDIREILLESVAPCELEGTGACDRYLAGSLDAASALATVHRIGAARHSSAPFQAAGAGRVTGDDRGHQQFAHLGMGDFAMSNSSLSNV